MLYSVCRSILRVLYAFLFRFEASGMENIPKTGGVVLCSNHLSVMDPTTIGTKLDRKVNFMAKADLFKIPLFGTLIRSLGAIPVKRGGVSKESIRMAISLVKDGGMIGIFPEGTRYAGPNDAGKKGAAMIAMRSEGAIIPVAIIGKYRIFRKMKIRYGKPVDISAIIRDSSSDALELVTDSIMTQIREMVRQG